MSRGWLQKGLQPNAECMMALAAPSAQRLFKTSLGVWTWFKAVIGGWEEELTLLHPTIVGSNRWTLLGKICSFSELFGPSDPRPLRSSRTQLPWAFLFARVTGLLGRCNQEPSLGQCSLAKRIGRIGPWPFGAGRKSFHCPF